MSEERPELSCHIVLPDTQVKPGVPTDHLRWIGQYIVDQFAGKPNVKVVHLGDHWDMESLSLYETKGSLSMEGRRVIADIKAGNAAIQLLNKPLDDYNAHKRIMKERQWLPERRILLRGNHENRLNRAIDSDAQLEGFLSEDLFESPGWEVVPFLKPIDVDGIYYCHYFYNPMNGRPYGGSAAQRLKTLGHSFVMGHQQILDTAIRYVNGVQQRGLICGTGYLHDEKYLGYQGNSYFRGILVLKNVQDGGYELEEVSFDTLCRRYEGMRLAEFMEKRDSE